MDKTIRKLLYRSFDRPLNKREQKRLDEGLAGSESLRREKEQMESLRRRVACASMSSFGANFSAKVMARLGAGMAENGTLLFHEFIFRLFRPVAIAATIIIITLISINISKTNKLSWEGAMALPEVTLTDAYDPLLAINGE
jgi:hypothetical protein